VLRTNYVYLIMPLIYVVSLKGYYSDNPCSQDGLGALGCEKIKQTTPYQITMYGNGTSAKPYQLSPSSLGQFIECQSCYLGQQLDLFKKPSSPFPQLPNGIDDTLRKAMIASEAAGIMPNEFSAIPELAGFGLADRTLVGPTLRLQPKDHIVLNGREFTLTGKLDELFIKNGSGGTPDEYIIADYKTKRSLKHASSPQHEAYVRQLRCYAMILRSHGHLVNDSALLLNYYPSENAIKDEVHPYLEFIVDRVDVSPSACAPVQHNLVLMGKAFLQATASGSPPPKKTDCSWCNYRA